MDTSPRFSLPMIIAAQAQKHLTHNEALVQMETLIQPVVQDMAALTPPAAPEDADCVVVGSGASDAFAGKDDSVAAWIADAWHFHTPQPGWMVVLASSAMAYVYGAEGWAPLAPERDNIAHLGINSAGSATNRLSVASEASLFTAETADHRLSINKASATDTATMVFQSGWSGRAEMGLAGTDGFAVKVSADGAAWHEALFVEPASGHVRLPARPIAVAYLDGGTRSFSAGDVAGFAGLSRSQGGMALGAALVSPATGAPLTVPADGLYQVTLTLKADTLGEVSLLKNGVDVLAAWSVGMSGSGGQSATLSAVIDGYSGDALALRFEDPATCYCYAGTTRLDVVSL